jgi:hypothetical protein
VYSLYKLTDEPILAKEAPELKLGERAFEIVLARKVAAGEAETQWFARHGLTPITELPAHWSEEYRSTVERRIRTIESDRNIALIERPECKRRWVHRGLGRDAAGRAARLAARPVGSPGTLGRRANPAVRGTAF